MAKRPYCPEYTTRYTDSQLAQLAILDEYIRRVRAILGLPTVDEHCHHAIDLLVLAYKLKHEVRTGELKLNGY